jgi:hypothetical protein
MDTPVRPRDVAGITLLLKTSHGDRGYPAPCLGRAQIVLEFAHPFANQHAAELLKGEIDRWVQAFELVCALDTLPRLARAHASERKFEAFQQAREAWALARAAYHGEGA